MRLLLVPITVVLVSACAGSAPSDPKAVAIAPAAHPVQAAAPGNAGAAVSASAAADSSPPDETPDPQVLDEVLLAAGSSSDGYGLARVDLGDSSHQLVVAVSFTPPAGDDAATALPEIAIAIVKAGAIVSRREGFVAITGASPDLVKRFGGCESWEANAQRVNLGTERGLRLGLVCSTGEDYRSSSELTWLVRTGPTVPTDVLALDRIWAGLGDTSSSEMGHCFSESTASFRVVDNHALEKRVESVVTWSSPPGDSMDPAWLSQQRRNCKVGKKQTLEVFKLGNN